MKNRSEFPLIVPHGNTTYLHTQNNNFRFSMTKTYNVQNVFTFSVCFDLNSKLEFVTSTIRLPCPQREIFQKRFENAPLHQNAKSTKKIQNRKIFQKLLVTQQLHYTKILFKKKNGLFKILKNLKLFFSLSFLFFSHQ